MNHLKAILGDNEIVSTAEVWRELLALYFFLRVISLLLRNTWSSKEQNNVCKSYFMQCESALHYSRNDGRSWFKLCSHLCGSARWINLIYISLDQGYSRW